MKASDIKKAILLAFHEKDFPAFAQYVQIKDKESGKLINLTRDRWTQSQSAFQANQTGRDIILKSRQAGFTSFLSVMDLFFALTEPGTHTLIVAHTDKLAMSLLREIKGYYSRFSSFCAKVEKACKPDPKLPSLLSLFPSLSEKGTGILSNAHQIQFANGSIIECAGAGDNENTATNAGTGKAIDRLHASEVAKWVLPEETWQGLRAAIGTNQIVMESTPKGIGNLFHQFVQDSQIIDERGISKNRFKLHFYPWFHDPKNVLPLFDGESVAPENEQEKQKMDRFQLSPEQLKWYRQTRIDFKNDDVRVETEYPSDSRSCFANSEQSFLNAEAQAYIESIIATPIRSQSIPCKDGEGVLHVFEDPREGVGYIVAGDPAGGTGGDNSALCVLAVDTMELAAIYACNKISPGEFGQLLFDVGKKYNVAKVAVENNNHGHTTLYKLNELGYPNLYSGSFTPKGAAPGSFTTQKASRKLLFDNLRECLMDGEFSRLDRSLVNELLIIAWNSITERYEAQGKTKHGTKNDASPRDDRAVCFGLALLIWNETPNQTAASFEEAFTTLLSSEFGKNISGWM